MNTYPVGLASIFATQARAVDTHVCGWCLESGEGSLVMIGQVVVLDSHKCCMDAVTGYQAPAECACYDPIHPGDNPNCPKCGRKA